jgi:hypothetical protein
MHYLFYNAPCLGETNSCNWNKNHVKASIKPFSSPTQSLEHIREHHSFESRSTTVLVKYIHTTTKNESMDEDSIPLYVTFLACSCCRRRSSFSNASFFKLCMQS